jgi:hypothetical protein
MPAYRKGQTEVNSESNSLLTIDWTISESAFDFDGRWIIIDYAERGHVHFHLNTTMARIQVWILEGKAWEEQCFRQNGINECDQGVDTHKMLRNPHFISFILTAKSRPSSA